MSVYHVPHRRSLPRRKEKYVAGPIASTSSSVLLDLTCRTRLPKNVAVERAQIRAFQFYYSTCHSGQQKGQEAVKSMKFGFL